MAKTLTKLLNSSILTCYFALIIVTPLLFSTKNTELFEVPKMLFVYTVAILIVTFTAVKAILEGKKSFAINSITISFLVFVIIQAASTVTSIDKFTSIFGYPTRLNGGLLSQVTYLYILVCALVNLNLESAKKLILAAVFTAFAVALWGIPAHFGYDPNCFVLVGSLNSSCWQKEFDPTLRIFSTLGQPNWLASYLLLVIPISAALVISTKRYAEKYLFAVITFILFVALIFTNSRAGLIGLVAVLFAFILTLGVARIRKNLAIIIISIIFFIIALGFFGKDITARIFEAVNPPINHSTGGTESSQIRLIVWKGALEVVKQNPLLGSGPETFAYSYYKVRPLEHNQTTEWNFFYNKAHNEFLNIFANVGILGGISYVVFLIFTIAALLRGSSRFHSNNRSPRPKGRGSLIFAQNSLHLDPKGRSFFVQNNRSAYLSGAVFSSIIGYQASIFFGFSVVATQTYMFILIACALIFSGQNQLKEIHLNFLKVKFLQIFAFVFAGIIGLYLLVFTARLFFADIFTARAKALSVDTNTLIIYTNALAIAPVENPFYLADAANSMALYVSQQGTSSIQLADQADLLAQKSHATSPNNILTNRKLANTYILLSDIDPKYQSQTEELGNIIVGLSPTDPQSYLSRAKTLVAVGKVEDAKVSIEKALSLKPDYVEALELLDQVNTQLTTED